MKTSTFLILIGVISLLLPLNLFTSQALAQQNTCASPKAQIPTELAYQGCLALDDFMATFNSRDALAWAKTLNYPHIRIAGGETKIWQTPEDYVRDNDLRKLAEKSGWGYSRWDWRNMVQQSPDKLHFTVQFTRYAPDGKKIASYESFYLLTKVNGRWGTQFRSSFAGVAVPGAAY